MNAIVKRDGVRTFFPPREAEGPFEIVSEYDSGKFDLGIIVSSNVHVTWRGDTGVERVYTQLHGG